MASLRYRKWIDPDDRPNITSCVSIPKTRYDSLHFVVGAILELKEYEEISYSSSTDNRVE